MQSSQPSVAVGKWIIALGALALIVFAYYRFLHVNPTTVALTLVLYVLLLAARMGLRYAVGVSVLATLCYNYFFLPPVRTLTITDPENWLALLAFLATGILGSRLSQQARDEAEHAQTRQREVELLLALSRELLQTDSVAELVPSIPDMLLRVSNGTAAVLFLLEGDRLYRAGLQQFSAERPSDLRQLALSLPDVETTPDGTVRIPLRAGVRPRGLLTFADLQLSDESYRAIGGLVSIAIDRAHALESVARTEAGKEGERLRSLILDSMTHEFRTPLTAIKGAASTLLTNTDVAADDRRELLTIVEEEADRLNRLVGQAVQMAQIEAQEVHMNIQPVLLADLLGSARENCASVFASHPVTVAVDHLPAVAADPEMIGKVLCNLLENAGKYSAPGTPIFVSAEQMGPGVLVSVADRGVGIDPAEQGLIFDRLYRARNAAQAASGTGMGLAISRAIVTAHAGEIQVTSQPGHGSVFTFSLPTA